MPWLVIAPLALGYGFAVRDLARRSGTGSLPTRRQLWSLTGAIVALVLALTWPLADLAAHWSLTALVVQRLLLTLAAAPLLLLAMPAPLLAALTRPATRVRQSHWMAPTISFNSFQTWPPATRSVLPPGCTGTAAAVG